MQNSNVENLYMDRYNPTTIIVIGHSLHQNVFYVHLQIPIDSNIHFVACVPVRFLSTQHHQDHINGTNAHTHGCLFHDTKIPTLRREVFHSTFYYLYWHYLEVKELEDLLATGPFPRTSNLMLM